MTQARWLWLVAAAGVTLFALSFVQGWIVQERELRGEGYRYVQVMLSAWRGVAIPVTAAAAVGALVTALWAAARATFSPRVTALVLVLGSALVVGLIGASAWPVMQSGHASTVRLSIGWLLPVILAVGLVMLWASIAAGRPSRRVLVAAGGLALVAMVAGTGGRWLTLQLAEGTGRHWEVGSYTRPATDGAPAETLTLDGQTFSVSERWSGTFESSGWTVVFDNDPACPDARGTYHAHQVGEEDLRFVKVVDTCLDGERARDLETGTWERDS